MCGNLSIHAWLSDCCPFVLPVRQQSTVCSSKLTVGHREQIASIICGFFSNLDVLQKVGGIVGGRGSSLISKPLITHRIVFLPSARAEQTAPQQVNCCVLSSAIKLGPAIYIQHKDEVTLANPP